MKYETNKQKRKPETVLKKSNFYDTLKFKQIIQTWGNRFYGIFQI